MKEKGKLESLPKWAQIEIKCLRRKVEYLERDIKTINAFEDDMSKSEWVPKPKTYWSQFKDREDLKVGIPIVQKLIFNLVMERLLEFL